MSISGPQGRATQRQTGLQQQPLVLLLLILLFCGAMAARLVWMQLLEHNRFRELADENRIRLVPRSQMLHRLLSITEIVPRVHTVPLSIVLHEGHG